MTQNASAQRGGREWGRPRQLRRLRRRMLAAAGVVAAGLIVWWASGALFAGSVPEPSTRVSAEVSARDWALAGRDPAHAAALPLHGGYEGREAWRVELSAFVSAGVAVSGGRVFAGAGDGRLLVLDAASGDMLWEYALPLAAGGAPAVTPDAVYVASRSGNLLALDRRDGSELWSFEGDSALGPAPIAYDGVLYAGAWSGKIYALDALNGELLWEFQADGNIVAPPAFSEGLMAIAVDDRTLSIVDIATGRARLHFDAGQTLKTSPVFADGLVLVGTAKGRLIAVDPEAVEYPLERGARFWRRQFFLWGLQSEPPAQKGLAWERRPSRNSALSASAVAGGSAYAASRDGRLHAFAVGDGEPLWEYDTGSQARSAPAVAGDFVYIGNDAGEVHVVDRRSGAGARTVSARGAVVGQIVATEQALFVTTDEPPALLALK